MLIHPWDQASREEWGELLRGHDFGTLVANGDPWPIAVPTHFIVDGDVVLLHLARPNPVWPAIEADPHLVLVVNADWAYVEAAWNANPDSDPAFGVPTSYYSSVQLLGTATIIDDPAEKAAILTRQLEHFERLPGRVPPSVDNESDRRQLPGIRALRIDVERVLGKQKYGGNKVPEHRRSIAESLESRGAPGDAAARGHLLRRLEDEQTADRASRRE